MKKGIKLAIYSIITFITFCLGISLQIKAAIGQSMINAFALTLSDVASIKVGTILNIINLTFFISYLIIRKTRFNYTDIIQVIATIANGYVINFFVYYVFSNLIINDYFLKVITFIIGLALTTTSLGAILAIGIIKFPLESFCLVICDILKKKLSTIRRIFDIIFLVTTLVITFIKGNTLYIREGTVVSFFLLSTLLGFSYSFFTKQLKKE